MITKIKPDYHITIGIKDNCIVMVDWKELSHEFVDMGDKKVIKHIAKYLKKALKFIK